MAPALTSEAGAPSWLILSDGSPLWAAAGPWEQGSGPSSAEDQGVEEELQ